MFFSKSKCRWDFVLPGFLLVVLALLPIGCATSPPPIQEENIADEEKLVIALSADEKAVIELMGEAERLESSANLMEALKLYRQALRMSPSNVVIKTTITDLENKIHERAQHHYNAGLAYQRQGKKGLAQKELLKALKYIPTHSGAIEALNTSLDINTNDFVRHVVKPGESLSKIAHIYYGDYRKYPALITLNNITDPSKVLPGQTIKVPRIKDFPFLTETSALSPEADSELSVPDVAFQETEVSAITPPQALTLSEPLGKQIADSSKAENAAGDILKEDDALTPLTAKALKGQQDASAEMLLTPKQTIPPIVSSDSPVNKAALHLESGIQFFNAQKYEAAIVELKQALALNPNDSEIMEYLFESHYFPAMTQFKKGEYLSAKNGFDAALAYKKECSECRKYIKESEQLYKNTHFNKGVAYFSNQQLAEAIQEWEMVVIVDSEFKGVRENIEKAKIFQKRLKDIEETRKKQSPQTAP